MKKYLKIMLYAALAGSMTMFTACGDEDEDPADVRDAAIGTYIGTDSQIYGLTDDNQLEIITFDEEETDNSDESGVVVVTKTDNANSIDIIIDGDTITGQNIKGTSDGFTFDIESINVGGLGIIEGFDAIQMGSNKYNGAFFADTKELQCAMKIPTQLFTQIFTATGETEDPLAQAIIQSMFGDYDNIVITMKAEKN